MISTEWDQHIAFCAHLRETFGISPSDDLRIGKFGIELIAGHGAVLLLKRQVFHRARVVITNKQGNGSWTKELVTADVQVAWQPVVLADLTQERTTLAERIRGWREMRPELIEKADISGDLRNLAILETILSYQPS